MKKVCCFFAICIAGFLALSGCKSTPKVKDVSETPERLEHKGTSWGVEMPEWVTTVLSTPNQKTLAKALGIDKHIWVVTKSGKNLDFLQTWVDQVDARAEIAASIKQGVADFVGAREIGEDSEIVEKDIERYSSRAEMVKLSGLNKETDWWTKTRKRLDKKSDYTEQYDYMVIYSIDEKLYENQIKEAYKDFDDEIIQELVEYLKDYTMVKSSDE